MFYDWLYRYSILPAFQAKKLASSPVFSFFHTQSFLSAPSSTYIQNISPLSPAPYHLSPRSPQFLPTDHPISIPGPLGRVSFQKGKLDQVPSMLKPPSGFSALARRGPCAIWFLSPVWSHLQLLTLIHPTPDTVTSLLFLKHTCTHLSQGLGPCSSLWLKHSLHSPPHGLLFHLSPPKVSVQL